MRFLCDLNTKGIIWILICALAAVGAFSSSAIADAKEDTSQNGRDLVRQGIDFYNNQQLNEALEAFNEAESVFADSIAVPYYKGLIFLKQGDRGKAVLQWKRYVAMAPGAENTIAVRKHITLLLRNEAKEFARNTVARQDSLLNGAVDDDTVAVTAFKNMGSETLAPLGKGMAAMVIADLSQFKDLKVVEREKLQALLAEMEMGTSGVVNEKSAPKVGKLLKAKYVTGGSLTDPQTETLQIASILLDADLDISKADKVLNGELKKFYELEKEIACSIAGELGRDCSRAPKAFGKIHTRSLPALVAYSAGLDYLDEEDYDEARLMFQKAVEEDPDFDLAQTALLATPAAVMLLMTESQIISSAGASAPSAAATATGTAAAATSAGAGGLGMGTGAAVAGGVVAAGGAVVAVADLAANEDKGNSDAQVLLGGQWLGAWSDNSDRNGTFILNLTQDGTALGGEATIIGTECISNADVSGRYANNRVTLNLSSSAASATLTAEITSNTEMAGDIEFTSGACSGAAMAVEANLTGSAVVRW